MRLEEINQQHLCDAQFFPWYKHKHSPNDRQNTTHNNQNPVQDAFSLADFALEGLEVESHGQYNADRKALEGARAHVVSDK